MDSWYYKAFGEEFGPLAFDQLADLAKSHTLSSMDEVRYGENGEWCFAGSIKKIADLMGSKVDAPPIPAVSPLPASNTVVSSRSQPSKVDDRTDEISPVKNIVWYYKIFGIEYGPVTFEQLIELAKTHTLYKNDEVRFIEIGPWLSAGSLGQLNAHLPAQSVRPVFAEWLNPNTAYPQMPAPVWQDANAVQASNPTTPTSNAIGNASETEPVWWCKIQDKIYGPIDLPKLFSWAASGACTAKIMFAMQMVNSCPQAIYRD